MLKRLTVLEARFQRDHLRKEEIDWIRYLDTNTEFSDRVTTIFPRDLADFLTRSDIDAFGPLDLQDVINEDSTLLHLYRLSNRRCQAAQESIAAESSLSRGLVDLIQAGLSANGELGWGDNRPCRNSLAEPC